MARPLLLEADLSQLFTQLSADLAQVQSMDEATICCAQMLQAALAPYFCQLVWGAGDAIRLLGERSEAPLIQPDAQELELLRAGQLALRAANEQVLACFAPLRARRTAWMAVCRSADLGR